VEEKSKGKRARVVKGRNKSPGSPRKATARYRLLTKSFMDKPILKTEED